MPVFFRIIILLFIFARACISQTLPDDLPLPAVSVLKGQPEGYIFASVPYWGKGNPYLVIYDNHGVPVFYKKMMAACTDFKMQDNGLLTYFDYSARKFFAMDSSLSIVDSFWVKNGYETDEHELKLLPGGNALMIGSTIQYIDMSRLIAGGDRNAGVTVNVIQETDRSKNVVFEWKAYQHFEITDAGPSVNLLDPSFLHTHINSIGLDLDSNLIISSRNLDEITKINRKTGDIIWRLGGKNNQFNFINDPGGGFSGQHSASILPDGNLLVYDNGLLRQPHYSRAVEYRLDTVKKTASVVWSYRNSPDVSSIYWGNVQRLNNGNTFISWGISNLAATEINPAGEKVFEMTFPENVYSYRIFRFPGKIKNNTTGINKTHVRPMVEPLRNFPNPFNPSTTISFEIPGDSHVSLKIFDMLGKEITTLADKYKKSGRHDAVFNSGGLPAGIYICRFESVFFSATKKIVLIK